MAALYPHLAMRETLGPSARAFVDSRHRRTISRGGNRCGKTNNGAIKAWNHLLARPNRELLIVTGDHKGKTQGVGKALHDTAPYHRLVDSNWNKRRGWKSDVIELDNGSTVAFRSGRGDTISISSVNATAIWCDEPPHEHLWGEIISRVATSGGPIWLTMTPFGVPVEWLRKRVSGYPDQGKPPTEDWDEHRLRLQFEDLPWRTPEDIQIQREEYSTAEAGQRINGEWEGVAETRALEDYVAESCMVAELPERPQWEVLLGFDHGRAAGHEICILVLYDDGRPLRQAAGSMGERRKPYMVAYDEFVNPGRSNTEQDAEGVRAMLLGHDIHTWDVDRARGDINVAGKAREAMTVNQDLSALLDIQIGPAIKGRRSVENGIRTINTAFRRGILKVHVRCKRLRRTCLYWDGSDDDYKHLFDGLSYIAVPELVKVIRGLGGPEVRLP